MDEYFGKLAFKNPVLPGATVSGFVLVNLDEGYKAVDIDLLGRKWTTSITLFVPDPCKREAAALLATVADRFSESELVRITDGEELWKKLEGLPCCASSPVEAHVAPLSLRLKCVPANRNRKAARIRSTEPTGQNWSSTSALPSTFACVQLTPLPLSAA